MKTFVRTEHKDNSLEFSWYDKNGRRYKHIHEHVKWRNCTQREMDNIHGYYAYAKKHDFKIIDDFKDKHPKRLLKEI